MSEFAVLRVRLTPKGGQDALMRIEERVLFARVSAPPVNGAANRALIQLVAKRLGVAKSRVSLVSGDASRDKTLHIEGVTQDALDSALIAALRGA